MKRIYILIIIALLLTVPAAFSNDPTMVPWPVGTSPEMIDFTKTLMNSYGDPNTWLTGTFHSGIDIDWQTEPYGGAVRSVIDGVISYIDDDYSAGYEQWLLVTTEGTSEFDHEDYGWWYKHLVDPTEEPYGWVFWEDIHPGDLIAPMTGLVSTPHVHFMWSWFEGPDPAKGPWNWCYVNPLDYLDPAPMQGIHFNWIFNPNNNDPAFQSFFLEDVDPISWPYNAGDVGSIMKDEYDLT